MKTQGQIKKELKMSRDTLVGICNKHGIVPVRGLSKPFIKNGHSTRVSALLYSDEQIEIIKQEHSHVTTSQVLEMKKMSDQQKQSIERFEKAHKLNDMGVSIKEISRILGVVKEVTSRYLSCKNYDEYKNKFIPKPKQKVMEKPVSVSPVYKITPDNHVENITEPVKQEVKKDTMGEVIQLKMLMEINATLKKMLLISERNEVRYYEAKSKKRNTFPFLGN